MKSLHIPINFFDHPKVKKYREASRDRSCGYLLRLLCFAGKEAPYTGHLNGLTKHSLEAVLIWEGKKGALLQALRDADLIVESPEGYQVIGLEGWDKDQGHFLKNHEKAKKAGKALWKGVTVDAPS